MSDSVLLAKKKELATVQEQNLKLLDGIGDNVPSQEQMTTLRDNNTKIGDLSADIKNLEEAYGYKKSAGDYLKEWNKPVNKIAQNDRELHEQEEERESKKITRAKDIIRDEQFKQWLANGAQGNSPRVPVHGVKTLVTANSNTSAGALIINDRKPIVDSGANRDLLSILDLINIGDTSSDVVEWVKETSFTNNSAETAEAEADGDPSGAKPESAFALEVVQSNVQTIAHWIPVTRKAMRNAGQVEGYINNLLTYGLRERLNGQVIAGNGVAPNLEGLATNAGVQTQVFSTNIIETLRKARTKVRKNGKAIPTAFAMSADDLETVELTKDLQGQYYFGGATGFGIRTVWGVPVVEDDGLSAGTAYVGDWGMAWLWISEDATVRVSESHSDYFTKNIMAMLAEMSVAFGVIRPSAFVKITTA